VPFQAKSPVVSNTFLEKQSAPDSSGNPTEQAHDEIVAHSGNSSKAPLTLALLIKSPCFTLYVCTLAIYCLSFVMTIFAFLNYQTMIKITLPDGSVKEFALGVTRWMLLKALVKDLPEM
jgi:hypothetical protein